MPEEPMDASAESSPATPAEPASPSAGTLNAEPTDGAADQQPPFHEHPRFQQLIGENRQLKAAVSELNRRLQGLEKPKTDSAPPEYVEAAEALLKILPANPKLKALLDLADRAPSLLENVDTLNQGRVNGLLLQSRATLKGLAEDAKLPADPDSLALLEEMIVGAIRRIDGGEARFLRGDPDVIREAFEYAEKRLLSQLRQGGAAALVSTKQKTKNLPPAPRGAGLPGQEPPAKLEPGKERQFESNLHKRAMQMIRERLAAEE